MSIWIEEDAKVLVQGITGKQGMFHASKMVEYGTNLVGGVTPGKGGQEVIGVPVFDSMMEAISETDADATVIYVPPPFAGEAIMEAANAFDAEVDVVVRHMTDLRCSNEVGVVDHDAVEEALINGPSRESSALRLSFPTATLCRCTMLR